MLIPGSFEYTGLLVIKCICAGIGIAVLVSGIYFIYKSNKIRNREAGVTETYSTKQSFTPVIRKTLITIGLAVMFGVVAGIIGFFAV